MKIAALFSLLLFAVPAFSTSQLAIAPLCCPVYSMFSPEKAITDNLTYGLWVPDAEGSTAIQFNQDGTALRFSVLDGQPAISFMTWNVKAVGAFVQLSIINNGDASAHQYVVSSACGGINLAHTTNGQMQFLRYHPLAGAAKLKELKANLKGEWTAYSGQALTGAPRVVRMSFDENRRFTRRLNTGTGSGFWELSKDGNFLLLHSCALKQPGMFAPLTVYQLIYCDDHALQLKPVRTILSKEKVPEQQPAGVLSFVK